MPLEKLFRKGNGIFLKDSAYQVGRLGVRALLNVQVCDQVGERVGLNDRDDADVRELCRRGQSMLERSRDRMTDKKTHSGPERRSGRCSSRS